MRGPRLFLTLALLFTALVFVLLGCAAEECPPCPECDPNDFTWEEIEAAIERLPQTPAPEWTPGPESMYAVERIGIKTYEDSSFYSGADLYFYSDEMTTQKMHIAGATGNIDGEGTLNIAGASTLTGAATFAGVITAGSDVENILLPTIDSAAIITTTNGAVWTAGASEIWFVHAVYCNITTNFDCTGDDCIIHIGDGNDEDGFLDLDDGELQTTDTEITGALAGWQGMYTDTAGAYLAGNTMNGFVYGNDTIDIKIEDASAHTDPTAGAGTCYLVYTRLQ